MSNIIHMENGKLATTTFADVEQMVGAAVDSGNMVIHFHGGLVSEAKAREIAARLTRDYELAGGAPIFPVWESHFFETVGNNLGEIAKERLFRVVLKRVLGIARRKFAQDAGGRDSGSLPVIDVTAVDADLDAAIDANDVSRMPDEPQPEPGLTELSDSEVLSLEMELQADPELQIVAQSVSDGLRAPGEIAADEATRSFGPVVASSQTMMDPRSVDRLLDRPDPAARGFFSVGKIVKALVVVAAKVIKRFISDRDHGFHATVVEEILREFYVGNIGGAIWDTMKGDTEDSFGDDHTKFGGTALLKVLNEKIASGAMPRVMLVGHSAGAVYIGHFLRAADSTLPPGFAFDVVLLAPAATFELTAETFGLHHARIGGMRMFTMTDDNEKDDRLVPVLYPHSLLYFISGVLEPDADQPVVGMARYYDDAEYPATKFPKVHAFRQQIAGFDDSTVWSVATGPEPGLESESVKHGDFDNDTRTIESVKHIIQNGF